MSERSKAKLALLRIKIGSSTLGDLVKIWRYNEDAEEEINKAISSEIITSEQLNEAEIIVLSPYEPVNKKGFELIPDNVACQDCTLLNSVESFSGNQLVVNCVTPNEGQKVTMNINQNASGGAIEISGKCMNTSKGISKK